MSFCVTKDSKLQRSALHFLFHKNPYEEPHGCLDTLGGFLSDLTYAWLVNGSRFIIVRCRNGARVASWDFANTLQDDTSEIIGIDEIQRPHGKEPLLAISINCDTSGGIICIFDFIRSKVIRAIQIGEHISSLHIIDSGQDIFNLSGPLRNFDGIFAVGTVGGNVYIVDICWQLCYEGFGTLRARDELNPCQMQIVTSQDLDDIENHKKAALRNESHLTIHLNVVHNNTTQHFVLKEPSGADKVHVNKQEVLISALHYCPPLGSILVGYNFGAFQLWNLMRMELIYTSPICDDHVPISKFAVQEPADDPRAFCYIWAVYSSDDLNSSLLPYLVMYALCYESKEFHESQGILYENFQYCAVRFHMELGFNNHSIVNPKGGKCLRLESLVHKNFITNSETSIIDGSEDVLSICVVVWKALCEHGQLTYMTVFDLNQWYKAQMPNSLNLVDSSSYMITLCVTDLIGNGEGSTDIYDLVVNKKSINQFMGTQRLEEHYHPSSLSFDTHCLLENRNIVIQYQGIQKALLDQLHSSGPLCLIRPTEIYQEIVSLGLTPLFVEISTLPVSSSISLKDQREAILNVALEQQLITCLCKCASEWANGSFSSAGCSLELLTSWAFRRGLVLKKNCDNICVPLFDYSELRLDTNTANILNNCIRQIKNISFFHAFVMKNLSTYVIDKDSLLEQCQILKMVEVYFDVLQWLFNVGLLPEYSSSSFIENASENRIRAPYPAEKLMQYYKDRRSELLLALNKKFCSKTSILFIDNLIDIECGGEQLWKAWKNDGGDGFYPPMSLQALLRTYLMADIEVSNKHAVVIYLFLDLAMILDPKKYRSVITHLIKFPAVFKVSPSLIKITQAFWQLDHGDFSTAMEQLLDPLVNQDDLKYWHHKIALKSLLIQEQHNSALLYMHVRKPPILDDEDVLCALSLFISNNMLDEAFYLEKHYKNFFNSKEFIKHLFIECSNYGRLSSIVYRNLSDDEEKIFLQYLDDVKHPEAADLKITYFMRRSYYIEAFKTYQSCEEDPSKKGLFSRLNSSSRDQIIHSYKKLLPTVSYKFIESCTTEPNPTLWKEVSRPEPMSVTVHGTEEKPEYKSSLIFAALAKAKQTFNSGVHKKFSLMHATTEELPFLRTPTLPSSRKRMSVQVIIPKVLDENEEDGPSPRKRSRLSPRSTTLVSSSNVTLESSILNTPLVVRKHRREISPIPKASGDITATPTSILKGISFVSGRKSVSRTPTVRFDVPKASTSSEEQTSSLIQSTSISDKEARSPKAIDFNSSASSVKILSHSLIRKRVSDSDDVFYSPNSSLNNIEEIPKDADYTQTHDDTHTNDQQNENDGLNTAEIDTEELSLKISPKKPAIVSEAKLVKLVDYESSSSSTQTSCSSVTNSPSARTSYKKLPNERSLVRSSPRLSRNQKLNSSEIVLESSKTTKSISECGDNESSAISPDKTSEERTEYRELSPMSELQLKPRKSLSRRVLENNAFSRLSSNNVDNSITKVYRTEQEDKSAIFIDNKKSEFTSSKTECVDVYRTDSTTSEKVVEHHSTTTSFRSVRETILDSDQDSSSLSIIDTLQKSEHEDLVSNSFMEDLVENLRQRRCREVSSYKQIDKPSKSEKTSDVVKEETPHRMTRARSKRLSMDRTVSPENISKASTSKRDTKRLSEDRTISSSDSSFRTTRKRVIASPRISRRLSSERSLKPVSDSKSSEINERKFTPTRMSRRLSAERSISSSNVSQLNENNEEQVEVLRFTSKSRISRRLSVDRSLPSEEYSQSSNTQTKIDEEKAAQNRFSKHSTPERSLSSANDSQSDTSNIVREKSDTLSVKSPVRSRTLSEESTKSSQNESQSLSEENSSKGVSQKSSKRLTAEKTIAPGVSDTSTNIDKEIDIIMVTPKLKCRKSLERQVLENNTLSRIISAYQCPDKKDNLTEINENLLNVKPISESKSNSSHLCGSYLSPSDSLLEEIAFGQLSSEKNILHNQVHMFDEKLQDRNEQSSIERESNSSYNCTKAKDEYLNQNEQDQGSSHTVTEEKNVENLELTLKESPILNDENDPSQDSYEKHQESLFNDACIIDDSDTEPDTQIQNNEKSSLLTGSTEEGDNDKSNSPNREITVKAINENVDLDISATVTVNQTENIDELSEISEANNVKESGEDARIEDKIENNEDFSMVYEDLSNESIKQNDPEMNIFEISDDLSLKESMTEEETNFPRSELTTDLDIMMPEGPLSSVFESNIIYSGTVASDENDILPEEGECSKPISNLFPEVIDIGSSSEDEIKSVSSQVSSSNNTSTTSSDKEEKKRNIDIPLHESEAKDIPVENRTSENEEQLISGQVSNDDPIASGEQVDNIKEETYQSEREFIIRTSGKENVQLETLHDKDSSIISGASEKFTSVNPEESNNKKSVELQTGKSLLEIEKYDKDEIQISQDSDAKNKLAEDVNVTPSRRMTRRRSKLLEGNDVSDILEPNVSLKKTDDLPLEDVKEAPILLKVKGSRLSIDPASPSQVNLKIELPVITSISKTVKTYCRKRTRSVDTPTLEIVNEESASVSRMPTIQPARRKLRSASVDIPINIENICRTREPIVKKRSPLSDTGIIKEKRKSKRKPDTTVKRKLVESYSEARRLTRRQSNIIETTLKEVDEDIDLNEIGFTSIETNERIELLDKSNFEGTPDPEEEKIYETTPSSVGMSSSVSNTERVRRSSRSSSNASEHSNARLSHKKTRSVSECHESPRVEVPRTRLRSTSTDEKEDTVKKIRRTKKSTAEFATSVESDNSSMNSKRNRKSTNPKRYGENSTTKSRKRKGVNEPTLSQIKEEN